jgi:hypothetical protein
MNLSNFIADFGGAEFVAFLIFVSLFIIVLYYEPKNRTPAISDFVKLSKLYVVKCISCGAPASHCECVHDDKK